MDPKPIFTSFGEVTEWLPGEISDVLARTGCDRSALEVAMGRGTRMLEGGKVIEMSLIVEAGHPFHMFGLPFVIGDSLQPGEMYVRVRDAARAPTFPAFVRDVLERVERGLGVAGFSAVQMVEALRAGAAALGHDQATTTTGLQQAALERLADSIEAAMLKG